MYLSHIKANNFRNLQPFDLCFSEALNIVQGNNAAGKSSLLEAIVFLLSGRSFRTSKQELLVNHEFTDFSLFGKFSDGNKIGVGYDRQNRTRKIKLNGDAISTLSQVASIYPVQVLSPESYHLIDSGPLERRKYVDWLLFHVEHSYQKKWKYFNKILKQRNAYLRCSKNSFSILELEAWDSLFVNAASDIDRRRTNLVASLVPYVEEILHDIGFEHLKDISFSYYPGYTGLLSDKLSESRNRDVDAGNTQYGPHKADLKIKIGKYLAKDVLSRGQKKLLVNSLYLAQTKNLKTSSNKNSLFVIDDFSSELDKTNQLSLVEALKEQDSVQIILSCLSLDMILPLIKEYNNVMMFHVEHGQIKVNEKL